ncbi:hypothetical protein TNCV_3205691 [Trichonephila clavipes]|nr:hypothetical protein TNCV_3205691 [Trichonephila clavipes]
MPVVIRYLDHWATAAFLPDESNDNWENTGKVLDIEVLSKMCRLCSKKTEDSISYEWEKHVGSSGAMEPVGVYRIFERSTQMRKLQ